MFELKKIDAALHDDFMQGHKKEHFMQSSLWGEIKSAGEWKSELLGLFRNGELAASALLLRRRIPLLGGYVYYAPRGFIVDFEDIELVKSFTSELKSYLKNKKAVYLMIDPDYPFRILDSYEKEMKSPDADFIKRMKSAGWRHRGFTSGFDGSQPRCTFRLKLEKSYEETFEKFDRFAKKSIRQSEDNKIEVYSSDDFNLFSEIMHETALRDGFLENRGSYYEKIYKTLNPSGFADLLFAKYDPRVHLESLKELIQNAENEVQKAKEKNGIKSTQKNQTALMQATQKLERLEKLEKSAEENLVKFPEGIVLSAGLNIRTKHRGWTVFGGSREVLRDLNANYAITNYAIRQFCEQGLEFIDFFGTIPNPDESHPLYGIHRFKKKFSGDYFEWPGEFHLVMRKIRYYIWINLYPSALKLLKRIKRRRKN